MDRPPDRPGDTDDGEEAMVLEEEDISESFRLCENSLIGRIFADRLFSVGTMEGAMDAIWSKPSGFGVAELGKNLFHFFFDNVNEVNRIVNGSPWLFKGFILHLEKWRQGLARRIGEVLEVDLFDVRGKENRIMKARVELLGSSKIGDSLKLSGPNLVQMEIGLRYERIRAICLYCAELGHGARNCQTLPEDSMHSRVRQEALGEWVKADQVGRHLFNESFKNSAKIPKRDLGFTQPERKPQPNWLAESLSKLNLKEKEKAERTDRQDNYNVDQEGELGRHSRGWKEPHYLNWQFQ
ncbi:hypothetical protein PIB30_029232 [Stylosanthes scabra]|uniref:DUF4283 domain-containing protein n=1 Tax=Stylosanthes scabra TaxID=79078 RepID=A0ABU6SCP5_9FABA|nr:hypothetical protein [Stylosanthes scabra]